MLEEEEKLLNIPPLAQGLTRPDGGNMGWPDAYITLVQVSRLEPGIFMSPT